MVIKFHSLLFIHSAPTKCLVLESLFFQANQQDKLIGKKGPHKTYKRYTRGSKEPKQNAGGNTDTKKKKFNYNKRLKFIVYFSKTEDHRERNSSSSD